MTNSNNKKHNTQIIANNKETASASLKDQLDLIEHCLNPKYPQINQCVLARCQHFAKCWGVGAKWKGDILGCKFPSKLEETHDAPEYVSLSKASKIYYLSKQEKDIVIEALHEGIKYLPMYKTSIEELIKKVEDCEELFGIG